MDKINIQDHYFPLRDYVVLKEEKVEKTAGGVYLSETAVERKLGLLVISVGPDVPNIKPGDYVTLGPSVNLIEFELLGETYLQVNAYNIIARVSPDLDGYNSEAKIEKAKREESAVSDRYNLATFLNVEPKTVN